MLGTVILALLAVTTAANPGEEPLAKASEGFIQCYQPNDITKSCQSIATYVRNEDGSWASTAIVLLSPALPVTLETVTTVWVKDSSVCGYIRREDILHGSLRVSGQLLPEEQATQILAELSEGMAPMMDREICTDYLPGPAGLIARATIEGGVTEIPDQVVKWVLPSDGYVVAPASSTGAGV